MCGNALEPQRNWGARPCIGGRAHADRRGDERLQLLFAQRSAPSFRLGQSPCRRKNRSALALRIERNVRQGSSQSDHRNRGRKGCPQELAPVSVAQAIAFCGLPCRRRLSWLPPLPSLTSNSPTPPPHSK